MYPRTRFILLLSLAMPVGIAWAQPSPPPKLAPVINEDAKDKIPGQYIVVFKRDTPKAAVEAAQATARKHDGKILHVYRSALIGFSAKLPPKAVEALRAAPGVAYIEADQTGHIQTIQPPNPAGNPGTGLDRIDRRLLPLNNTYTYSETGTGVHAYILDTGIRVTNTEFGGRASGAVNEVADGNTADTDCHGHGTNVAGIVGANTYGVAKQVTLHSVRVAQCTGSVAGADAIAGVDWVTANATAPAVANMSIGFGPFTALDTAVGNAIAANVTFVVSAGNGNADACTQSPARVPAAITVGNVDPSNDTRWGTSNFGTCVDLFAPGVNILSAGNASDSATSTFTGTSQASPHVAGVAARYLQTHPAAAPAAVWTAIHAADDVTGTAGWAGITDPGVGSPNELLHWGSLNDGVNDGDPHLTTVDGIHYDFQSAGEFVTLRDGSDLEIQTRQTPVATTFNPGANPYTGLATCVSLNTAVAARVGSRRVTYQPNVSGVPDPSGLQLRVDGVLTPLGTSGFDLGDGGRVVKAAAGDGIEVDFPDGTVLHAIPGWWASQGKWYMNVRVYGTRATEGILGALAPLSWLPALPDGSSLGPMPTTLHQRYVDLYQKFADAWRVTDQTSLFDYAPGTSTSTFTMGSWPLENPPCAIPDVRSVKPVTLAVAENACQAVTGKNAHADCVFDVRVTGEPGFAKTYLAAQRIARGATTVDVVDDVDPTQPGESVTFTATVARATRAERAPAGTVQFFLDGSKVGKPVPLDAKGRAAWETSRLKVGTHHVAASFVPVVPGGLLASRSRDEEHIVKRCFCERAADER